MKFQVKREDERNCIDPQMQCGSSRNILEEFKEPAQRYLVSKQHMKKKLWNDLAMQHKKANGEKRCRYDTEHSCYSDRYELYTNNGFRDIE